MERDTIIQQHPPFQQPPPFMPPPRPASSAPWVLLFFTLAGAGGAAYWMHQRAEDARQQSQRADDKAKALESEKRALAEQVGKLEAEKTELSASKEELVKDVQAKTTELAELKGTYDKLEDKMRDEIAKGDILLTQSGGKLRVDLVDKVLFDSGESAISKRGAGVLARVGAILAEVDDKQIQVSGHTDATPISDKLAAEYPSNWELSVARAVTVVRFLQEQAHVPPERLVASGYGEHQPVASNKSATGRARNRRIEILLTPLLAPKAVAKAKLKERTVAMATKPEKQPAPKPKAAPRPAHKTSRSGKPIFDR